MEHNPEAACISSLETAVHSACEPRLRGRCLPDERIYDYAARRPETDEQLRIATANNSGLPAGRPNDRLEAQSCCKRQEPAGLELSGRTAFQRGDMLLADHLHRLTKRLNTPA